ncbi:GntP family permease [Desulfitobacterium metallireducens]|uniref:Transporter n=1 Tax=Desulfitobacterium metallireducens DSM 15288 TaxID=871968 RepID=W0E5R6_9FIRM|nr:GntP family permease [Desulfitobacterium metallireducens]AHF06180.1 transporter [Desulfitobacterium metallireducens DSM 15288]
MLGVIGILLGLGLLMFMAYKGYSVIFFAPVFALLAAVLSGLSLLPTYTEVFLPNLANYVKVYFPFFLLGAVFGKAMEESGAAASIAKAIVKKLGTKRAILSVVLSCAILTYGGVSLFVVAFAVYPFAANIFKEADIPKRLIPATIALGAFTFTMDALPGTPQIQNSIPMKFFNTDLYAAPVTGILGTLMIFGSGMLYLEWRRRKAQASGEGYGIHSSQEPELIDDSTLPNPFLATIPLISVLVMTLILQKAVFPHWNIVDWAVQAPYKMDKAGIVGTMNNWALMIGLVVGILLAFIINPKKMKGNVAKAINAGAIGSLLAVMNTGSEVGFGNVIKSLPGFQSIAHALMNIRGGGSPLLSEAVTVNVLAGVTGSASGGMSIALDAFGKDYLSMAQKIGLSPELLHRIASMSSGGMDTLPHNGAVITLLAITGMTHKQAYKDIFALTLMKIVTPLILIGLSSIFHFV